MSNHLDSKVALLNPHDTLLVAMRIMGSVQYQYLGIGFVVDADCRLLGVINYADILRYFSDNEDVSVMVKDIMIDDPVSVPFSESSSTLLASIKKNLKNKYGIKKKFTQYIPLLDDDKRLLDVVDCYSLLQALSADKDQTYSVAIYGLGFVGLTLAAFMSSRDIDVIGIDVNENLIDNLNKGIVHIHEPMLDTILSSSLSRGKICFAKNAISGKCNTHVISVGTPVNEEHGADISFLNIVAQNIGRILEKDDLVILRSTVPVSTTRKKVIPILETESGLIAGRDFFVSFSPERTVEGSALQELSNLPQVVGSYSSSCQQRAIDFWTHIGISVVPVQSMEAAELVKLLNNSFRDLSFAFSNEFVLLADRFNLDAVDVINAANEGYPRNPIAKPSPGVGGYCLTKDPYLYSTQQNSPTSSLSFVARQINESIPLYPYNRLLEFCSKKDIALNSIKPLVVGIAFKGIPETNDIRFSPGLALAETLHASGLTVSIYDSVVEFDQLEGYPYDVLNSLQSLNNYNALFFMNNNPKHSIDKLLSTVNRDCFLFDGWNLFDKNTIKFNKNIVYSSLGYLSLRND